MSASDPAEIEAKIPSPALVRRLAFSGSAGTVLGLIPMLPTFCRALFGESPKDINRCTEQAVAFTHCWEPFQIDFENFWAVVELREAPIHSDPKGPVAAWQDDGIGFVGQVLREQPISGRIRVLGTDQQKLVAGKTVDVSAFQ